MELFDDGLSEDWISQPRSSDGPAAQDDTSILRRSTSTSRIPLPKSHSLSSLPRRFSGHVLAEKTKSALNIESAALSSRQQPKRISQMSADASVDEDCGSVRRGTVQHKEQGQSVGARQGTPEWKRRLLNGKGASSRQQDLFSPMGLENVFRPPTVRKETGAQLRRTKTMPPSSVPPSSPPVLPSRVAPSIASDSLNESIQLPRLPPMPRSYSNLRKASKATSRMSSGKSYLQHESFSPVQLPPTDTESSPEKGSTGPSFQNHHSQREVNKFRPASSMSDSALDMLGSDLAMEEAQADADVTSVSLPDDLNPESATYAFVTMRRGGFSSEGSFQRRPLSPSSFQPQSTPTLLTTARQVPAARSAPQTPHARDRVRNGGDRSQENPRSSGSPHKLSPLKLFDKYDTFTNDRLNRRISQFEASSEDLANEVELLEDQLDSTPSPTRKQSTAVEHSKPGQGRKKRMSSFGEGTLDQYNFTHTHQRPDILKWQRNAETAIQSDSALPYRMEQNTKRTIFKSIESHSQWNLEVEKHEESELPHDNEEPQLLHDGKRQRSSPQKIPNAKRRRTINEQTEEYSNIQVQKQRPSLSHNSSMAGRKRKDARYESSSQTADPETIATRAMLRPRARQQSDSGTARQTSTAKMTEIEGETGEELIDLEKATGVLAGELANLALNVAEGISHGVRKKSVTTADFFREANLIMHNLRSNAIKRDDASEASPSHNGHLNGIEESAAEMFSTDNFSRPPSREGSPARRKVPGPKDFRVISRLRKFEDTDDIGLALNSSFQGLPRTDGRDGTPDSVQSEPSNIRILDPPRNRKHAVEPKASVNQESAKAGKAGETTAYPSSKSSSNRSVQTGSSGTRTKAVIPPDRVAHLINSNMGRMTFDEQKGCWVKRKPSEEQQAAGDRLESEATEDDPFREIPDLDVDESQEMRTVRTVVTSRPPSNELPSKPRQREERQQPRKESQDDKPADDDAENSQMTKQSRIASGGATIETTTTSWGTQKRSSRDENDANTPESLRHEAAQSRANVKSNSKQARVVTVAFSSPLVQPIPPSLGGKWDEISDIEIGADGIVSEVAESPMHNTQQSHNNPPRPIKPSNAIVNFAAQHESVSPALPKIDESDKASSPTNSAHASNDNLAVTLATPQATVQRPDGALSVPSVARSYVALQLTPLSDFTVHHVDESLNLDVQYIAKRRGLASLHEIEGRFSLSIKDLVEKIADVEPYEPYWEQMRALHLQDRGLLTLHMLDEFCGRVEELDVSGNELGQLNGAPQSLRVLEVQNNCLSSLTAWGHLCNLQYLDVSNNEIDSLAGFRELIHLRELRAEHNQIQSLEGILHLNGLLKLHLGNNAIQHLDFNESDWKRLIEFDVHHNEIVSIAGLEQLQLLQVLNLRANKITEIDWEKNQNHKLRFLDVSENQLSTVDVSGVPNLHDLLLDSNSVAQVSGLLNGSNVRHILWRAQRFPQSGDENVPSPLDYNCCMESLNLSLAGTRLVNFAPVDVFLSLARLDLASCGLDSLIKDFGMFIPNVRHLNLNYNAIKDMRPLLGIRKLTELHIAGNRIKRFRRTIEVICKVGPKLRTLDCRNNSFTSGFYMAPHLETTSKNLVLKAEYGSGNRGEEKDPFDASVYIVPDAITGADDKYLQQLDFNTRIRRRVYELMLLKSSPSLKKLDGLPIDETRILASDGIWERLIELGVIQMDDKRSDE